MRLSFTEKGWADYLYWQTQDGNALRRVNLLLQDIDRNGYKGIGKPEALRGNLAGWHSRHIDNKNRLIYQIEGDAIVVRQCCGHYGDK